MELTGIHHVSALTAKAQENLSFYTETLGMRLVKKTVNQDDPTSYHLFYADGKGSPGCDLTFFDIPQLAANHPGASSISSVGLRVRDVRALDYWGERLGEKGVAHEGVKDRFGWSAMAFRDFEGQRLILYADRGEGVPGGVPWEKCPVPQEMGIVGLGPVTLTVRHEEATVRVLTEVMGFRQVREFPAHEGAGRTLVFATGMGGAGAEVQLEVRPELPRERQGYGGVHHVAFRVSDEEQHRAWLERIESFGLRTSGLVDRFYFRSIYFREPAGILFELATDGPGFATDEDEAHLGERLALPPFLEPHRAAIEARLHPLDAARA